MASAWTARRAHGPRGLALALALALSLALIPGKSTVLREYARRRPHFKILYLTYGKDVSVDKQVEYNVEGLRHVEVRTTHSFAWQHTRHLHRGKTCKGDFFVKPREWAARVGGKWTEEQVMSSLRSSKPRPSPITHRPSPIAHYPPPITHHQSPITHHPSPITHINHHLHAHANHCADRSAHRYRRFVFSVDGRQHRGAPRYTRQGGSLTLTSTVNLTLNRTSTQTEPQPKPAPSPSPSPSPSLCATRREG